MLRPSPTRAGVAKLETFELREEFGGRMFVTGIKMMLYSIATKNERAVRFI